MATPESPLRLAILASGQGTTLLAIANACAAGTLMAEIVVVIVNNSGSGALRQARERPLHSVHLSSLTHPNPEELDEAMLEELVHARTELVVLAGFLKKVGPRVLSAFNGKIINTHPALLPKFGGKGMYGTRVHEAVLAAGEANLVSLFTSSPGNTTPERSLLKFKFQSLQETLWPRYLSECRLQIAERAFLVHTLQGLACGG